jgi:hypothetical protein
MKAAEKPSASSSSCARGIAKRVAHGLQRLPVPHQAAGPERADIEAGQVHLGLDLFVCGEQHLEASVEQEAVDLVRPHPPSDRVRGVHDVDVDAGAPEETGTCESGESGSDDEDIGATGKRGGIGHGLLARDMFMRCAVCAIKIT